VVAATVWADAIIDVDAAKQDADFALQGEYVGKDGKTSIGAQVVALGGGKFDVYILEGGLPGAGWVQSERVKLTGEATALVGQQEDRTINGRIADGRLTLTQGAKTLTLQRIERRSDTLGAKPPEGAI